MVAHRLPLSRFGEVKELLGDYGSPKYAYHYV